MEGIIPSIDWSKGTFVLSACSSVENVVSLNMFPATWFSNIFTFGKQSWVYTWTIKRKLMFVTTLFSCELPRNPYQHLDKKTMHIALRETYWRQPYPCNSFDYLDLVNLLVAAFDVEMFYSFLFALIKCVRNKSNWNSSLWQTYLFFQDSTVSILLFGNFLLWNLNQTYLQYCLNPFSSYTLDYLVHVQRNKPWCFIFCASTGKSKFRYSNE